MPDQTRTSVWQRPYHGRLFGTFALSGADGANLTPHGRKARALTAYLLLAGSDPVPRERATGLLWGDRGEDQARASLRQTLYELRPLTAGTNPLIRIGRSEIQLVEGTFDTDLDQMRSLSAGSDANSFASWLGEQPAELLVDLDGVDAGFGEWLTAERARRREERHAGALAVCSRALQAGDSEAAYLLAARLLTVEPFDERAARLGMEACRLRGDRSGVHRIFTQYRTALEQELGLAVPDEIAALHKRLMTAAALPARPALTTVPDADTEDETGPATVTPAPLAAVSRRPWVVSAAGAAVVAVISGLWIWSSGGGGERLLLVTPLHTTPDDSSAKVLRDGLSSELAQMIVGNDTHLSVIDPRDDAPAVPRGGDYMVAGEAQTSGDALHASVRLLDHQDNTILWSGSFVRPVAEVEEMREQIASKIADVTVCALSGRNPTLSELGLETMRLYLAACEQKHGDWTLSAKLLAQVVKQRPNFAHGWAMLAAATSGSADLLPKDEEGPVRLRAEEYARHALSLDPNDGEAYPPHAYFLSRPDQWPQRMDILVAGHKADPANAVIDWSIGAELAEVGRRREGIEYTTKAFEADPFSQYIAGSLGRYFGYRSRAADLEGLLAKADKRWPGDPDIADLRFRVAALAGDPAVAAALLADPHRRFTLSPDRLPLWQKTISARQEGTPQAIETAAQALTDDAARADVDAMFTDAMLLVRLGRIDEAYAITDRIGRRPIEARAALFYDLMAPFRADPRFMDLAERQGLVAIWKTTAQWPDFCGDPSLRYDCHRVVAALTQ